MSIAPPRPLGPPLNSLRAFEAAARLGGFAAAASELGVTPGAVAQQIKGLEAWICAALFERRAQGVRLTPLGQHVLAELTKAFDLIGAASQKLRNIAAPLEIRIAALPSIAQLWLSPRLKYLRAAAPEVQFSVTALEHRPNLQREPFDLSLFYAAHPLRPGQIEIERDEIFPVCSPGVAATLKTVSDLERARLLHDASWSDDWTVWLATTPQGLRQPDTGSEFSLYSLAVEEAKASGGVLIGHNALVRPFLLSGDLVAPFSQTVARDRSLVMEKSVATTDSTVLASVVDLLLRDTHTSIS